jgi:hypothetical protein
MIVAVGMLVDSLLVNKYLGIISKLLNSDEQTQTALENASIFQLRKLAIMAENSIAQLTDKVDTLLSRAAKYPHLIESKSFQNAVRAFYFEKAEAMLAGAEKAARYASEQAKNKDDRQSITKSRLLSEALKLGLTSDQIDGLAVSALRDVVEQTKEKKGLLERALVLGCMTYVEQLFVGGVTETVSTFLLRAETYVGVARELGVEQEVRELVSYGNLESVDQLLQKKKDKLAFIRMESDFSMRIGKLKIQHQHKGWVQLSYVRTQVYGTREFNKAVHDLENYIKGVSVHV